MLLVSDGGMELPTPKLLKQNSGIAAIAKLEKSI